jgi:hypothetical protein
MKKKSTSQIAFFSLRVLISLMIFLAGIMLVLLAMANPQALIRRDTAKLNTQAHRADDVLLKLSGTVEQG